MGSFCSKVCKKCELILNILKRIYKKLCVVCLEIPFDEDLLRIETSQIDLQLGSNDFLLKFFVYLFIYLSIYLFIYFTIYCMSQWIGG